MFRHCTETLLYIPPDLLCSLRIVFCIDSGAKTSTMSGQRWRNPALSHQAMEALCRLKMRAISVGVLRQGLTVTLSGCRVRGMDLERWLTQVSHPREPWEALLSDPSASGRAYNDPSPWPLRNPRSPCKIPRIVCTWKRAQACMCVNEMSCNGKQRSAGSRLPPLCVSSNQVARRQETHQFAIKRVWKLQRASKADDEENLEGGS